MKDLPRHQIILVSNDLSMIYTFLRKGIQHTCTYVQILIDSTHTYTVTINLNSLFHQTIEFNISIFMSKFYKIAVTLEMNFGILIANARHLTNRTIYTAFYQRFT